MVSEPAGLSTIHYQLFTVDMLLAVDIGNSATKFVLFQDDNLTQKFSIPTRRNTSAGELKLDVGDRIGGVDAASNGRVTLALSQGAIVLPGSALTIQASGTLTGDGRVAGSVFNHGTLLAAPNSRLIIDGGLDNHGLVTGSGRGIGSTVWMCTRSRASGPLRSIASPQLAHVPLNRSRIRAAAGDECPHR